LTLEPVPRETCVHPFLSQAFQVRKLTIDSLSVPHLKIYRYMPEEDSLDRAAGLSAPSVGAAYAAAGGGYQQTSSYQGSTD
jgi:hypothetical protein